MFNTGDNMKICTLCPRRCGVDRTKTVGRCGCGEEMRIARAALHFGEEPPISGTNGSGTIFFGGCSLGCIFCQNSEISRTATGRVYTVNDLAEEIKSLEEQGAHNINFVTGTQYADRIIEALCIYRPDIPVVWNTGGYETVETVEMLSDYVDIWLPDLKYAASEKAERYSKAPDYPDTAFRAVRRMIELSGPLEKDEKGIAVKGVLIRHLILPSNTKNSIAVLERIAEEFGTEIPVSLMSQYTPHGDISGHPEINRRITRREYDKVCAVAMELGIGEYTQELSSAEESYIPEFNLEKRPL